MKYKARKEKKAAQKKYEAPVAYYSGLETDFYFETKSAKTAGWTDEGREYLKQAKPFCECLRTIVSRLINKTDYTKPDLSAKYNLSSRLFNSAEVLAKGEFASLQETKVLALDLSKAKYDLALYHYAQDYVTGMDKDEEKRKIARIGKWRKKIDINEGRQEHPIYRPGYDVYRRQHQMTREDFRKEWDAVRNNRIASIGVWDEPPCCNSELQVHFDDKVEDINKAVSRPYRFKIIHSRKVLCTFKLPKTEAIQVYKRLNENATPYQYQTVVRLAKSEEELRTKVYGKKFIGPILFTGVETISYEQKIWTNQYIPLTVVLLRDKKKANRWQIRVGWKQPGVTPYEVTNTFLSYDINNDSVAYTLFRLLDGKKETLFKTEVFFPSETGNAKHRANIIHDILNRMMAKAKEAKACVIGEGLNFEGAKTGFAPVSAMLHRIPYRQIKMFVDRKALKLGVPVRYINPAYTSLLGGLFPEMNRDEAGAFVVGLKGSQMGVDYLEAVCKEAYEKAQTPQGFRLKVEVKNNFSEIVRVEVTRPLDRVAPNYSRIMSQLIGVVVGYRKNLHYRAKKSSKCRIYSKVFLDTTWPTARPCDPPSKVAKVLVPVPNVEPSAQLRAA